MRQVRRTLFAAAILFPLALPAQGVTVQSVDDIHFFGALGGFVGFAAKLGGAKMHDIESTTIVDGHRLRTESDDNATIIDVDAGRFITIDKKAKTYQVMTFEQMAAFAQRMAQSMKQGAVQQQAQVSKQPASTATSKADKSDVTFHYSATTDRPGQHENIAGYDAERVFLTITIEADTASNGQTPEQAGSLVFLIDQWRSTNAPQLAAMQEFQRAYAQKAGEMFRPPVDAMKSAYSFDPRIKEGFSAAAKEMAKVPGVALRTVTYVAGVPAGMKFDRSLVLADAGGAIADTAKKADEPKKSRFGGFMNAVKSVAEQSAKNSANTSNGSGKADTEKQGTLLSVSEEAKSITRGAVPAGTFDPPAGYRELPAMVVPPGAT